MSGQCISVLLVDDQKLFVESLSYVLESRAPDIEIVGIARDGNEALEALKRREPDIILMDVRMPGMDGVQATRVVHELYPRIKIVMLSTFEDQDYVRRAMAYGAIGYLIKNVAPEEVIKSIRAVKRGVLQISPAVARALSQNTPPPMEEGLILLEPLTRREKEVLRLILKAYENTEIAKFLQVSEQTARNYVHSLYSKLGVSNRVQLLKLVQGGSRSAI